jgi:hypothetical protein
MPSVRIIFLGADQYSRFDHNRFGFDILQERGFAVEFWDCSKIFRSNFQSDKSPLDSDGFSGLRCFEKREHLMESISRLTSQDVLILTIGYDIKTRDVLSCAANTPAILGMLRLGNLPIPKVESSFLGRIEKIIRRPSVVANFFLQKLSLEKLGLRPLDFILKGGADCLRGAVAYFKGEKTKILNAHAMDYDRCLLYQSDSVEKVYSENVVFLDDGGPFHRDGDILNVPFPCSVDEYFFNVNSFFRLVEEKFNCSVLVASHPRVQYDKRGDPFEGRSIIQGETHKLVKHSKFVISVASTSLNFPIIYRKPVIFLPINPTKRNRYDAMIKNLAENLGKLPICWADKEEINWEKELVIDKDRYDKYMEVHIKKSGSLEKPCWDILADYLTSLTG